MRIMECVRLRVKHVDFGRGKIAVRQGKGAKDRMTMLPQNDAVPLKEHLVRVKKLHEADREAGYGEVYLPDALSRKYPGAPRQWAWQYVFPPARAPWTRVPEWCAGAMRTRRHCRGRCTRLCDGRALLNWPRRIRCDIRSPPTSCNPATTSAQNRSSGDRSSDGGHLELGALERCDHGALRHGGAPRSGAPYVGAFFSATRRNRFRNTAISFAACKSPRPSAVVIPRS